MVKYMTKILSIILILGFVSCDKVKKEKEVTLNSLSAVKMSASQEAETKKFI